MTDVVGSAAFELRATREKMKADLKAAEADLKGFTSKTEADVAGSSGRIGGSIARFASVATVAVGALVSVLGLAAAAAFNLSFQALKFADEIANSAKRVNVGTDALQEFRFVAKKVGEDASAADQALSGFGKKLGEAASGLSKEAGAAFAAIGISPEQIRSFKTTEEALDATIDAIGELGSEADRAAIAEKLGLGPLAAALRQGSDEIAAMRDEARQLGVVMDAELVQRASEAQGQFDTLSQVIDVNLKSAFVDLAPVLISALNLINQATAALGRFADRFRSLSNQTGRGLAERSTALQAEITAATQPARGRLTAGERLERQPFIVQGKREALANINAEIAARARANIGADQSRPSLFDTGGSSLIAPAQTTRATRSPRDTSANDAIRAAELEARRTERFQDQLDRARQRLLGLAEAEADTAQARFDAAQASIAAEREIRDADLDRQVIAGELTEARRTALDAANAEADAVEDRVLTDRAFREIDEERLATERLLSDLSKNLLSLQSGGARTASERRRIELELLEIAQRERRDALNRELERKNASAAQRSDALGTLEAVDGAERGAVMRGTQSPLEQWRDESLRTTDEIREAYENVAARGLDALNDGIVDAIVNSKNLGDVFSNVAKQIIADLAAIAVRRSITEPLANLLFGGGTGGQGGGGGNFLSSIIGMGRAALGGGAGSAGGGIMGAVTAIAGPKAAGLFGGTSSAPSIGKVGPSSVMVVPSPYFDLQVQKVSSPIAIQTGQAGAKAGSGMAQNEIAKRTAYRTR